MEDNQKETLDQKTDGTPEDTVAENENSPSDETVETTEGEAASAETDELTATKAALSESEDRYLRLQAELANIRRRNQKEKEDAAKYRSQPLATELLPVLDNLERALAIEINDGQEENLKKGLVMVLDNFKEAFKKEGIETIDPLNEPFNPNFHQAVQTVPVQEGQEPDTVVNVFQKGYILNERVLRPAMVVVAQ